MYCEMFNPLKYNHRGIYITQLLPYDELQQRLSIESTRSLERLLVSGCIYGGLIKGRLDQRERCLLVEEVAARDVAVEAVPRVVAALEGW
jgi:COP9 signalosome complex subunit 7